jgi:orotate phosphoribosyltransferase
MTEATAADRDRLGDLLRTRSLRTGDFVLSSGARSTYYIDARLTTMAGRGQQLIGRLGIATLDALGWRPDSIGGLTLGADPVAYAIAHAAADEGRDLDAFTVRKAAKEHGRGQRIEGGFEAGHRVVVVEDVITTGQSALNAIEAIEQANGSIVGILALVDRQEGGAARLREAGYEVASLFEVGELLQTP